MRSALKIRKEVLKQAKSEKELQNRRLLKQSLEREYLPSHRKLVVPIKAKIPQGGGPVSLVLLANMSKKSVIKMLI